MLSIAFLYGAARSAVPLSLQSLPAESPPAFVSSFFGDLRFAVPPSIVVNNARFSPLTDDTAAVKGAGASADVPGSGIGLALVHQIVRLMNGSIFILSSGKSGTIMRFEFPIE